MATVSMTGQDTIKIGNRSLVDFADAEVAKLTYPNELVGVKTGKNGNSLFGFNETGRQCELELRLVRGSADDKFLLNQLALMKNNFSGYVLLTGEIIKRVGDGAGNISNDTYILSSGVIVKEVEVSSNADGSTDQSVAMYHLKFTNGPRVIT